VYDTLRVLKARGIVTQFDDLLYEVEDEDLRCESKEN
jgi:hypothetical protein